MSLFDNTLLLLCPTVPGLPGPCLHENLAPYQVFDALGGAKPKVILTIGGWVKNQWLAQKLSITIQRSEPSVALTTMDDGTLLIDCELHSHDARMPQPPAPSRNGNRHIVANASGAKQLAYRL